MKPRKEFIKLFKEIIRLYPERIQFNPNLTYREYSTYAKLNGIKSEFRFDSLCGRLIITGDNKTIKYTLNFLQNVHLSQFCKKITRDFEQKRDIELLNKILNSSIQ